MVYLFSSIFLGKLDKKTSSYRLSYGMLCSTIGIFFNIVLFSFKFIAGMLSKSIAITADAFNNLSDAGSSFMTLIGFKMSSSKPDPHHPFGHGRIEYLTGLFVAIAILLMAFELFRTSFDKILHPSNTEFSYIILVILIISILVKLYMAYYNYQGSKLIDSAAMKATCGDSLSDAIATLTVLISSLITHFSGIQIDGWCGIVVALFIFATGISAARDTINPLLGQPPKKEFVEAIEGIVLEKPNILGIHDLVVHDYGPGRVMISLHAEVPATGDLLELHDIIDLTEQELKNKLHCEAVIHMDPIQSENEEVMYLKSKVINIIKNQADVQSFHDFRIVKGPTHTNLIFDIVVSMKSKISDEQIVSNIQSSIFRDIGSEYYAVINVDRPYI